MNRLMLFGGLILTATLGPSARRAVAQSGAAMLADDIIVLSKGQRAQEKARTETPLGVIPGTTYGPFRFRPATEESVLEQRPEGVPTLPTRRRRREILSAITESRAPTFRTPSRPAEAERTPRTAVPIYGSLEIPQAEDEGPPHGLTLDMAIDRLVHENADLRTKFFEIPQADADILSAGLRANPILFASADAVPYGSYSPQRPGANDYTAVIVQPFDVSGKARARTVAARQAKSVLEAQFQNAVRLEIDNLYNAFTDVLDARAVVRYARASVEGFTRVLAMTEAQYRKGSQPHSEVDRIAIQRDNAANGLDEAIKSLRQANQVLAYLLNFPDAEADRLEVRGRLRDERIPPPPVEELIRIAHCARPDLAAFRLGVRLAEANVAVERAERFEDVFLLYTPATYTNNGPIRERSTTSWSLGGVASVPLFNRNQGNIARAKLNVVQSQIEVDRIQRQIAAEVRRAYLEYDASRAALVRIERDILPRARHLRDDKFGLFSKGEEDSINYLNAQRDYNDAVRQHRDTIIRHRRSTLRLNTVVGQRILP